VPESFAGSVCTSALDTCEEIAEAYAFLVDEYGPACGLDAACHFVPGHCQVGLGSTCYYALSTKVAAADLEALAQRFSELECFDPDEPICECPAPPESVDCLDGLCGFAF
jgi:hypothetical protein